MRPKSTAETVLIGVWLTICDRKLPVSEDLADYTRRMIAATGSPALRLFRYSIIRWFAHRMESRVLPGVCAHYTARKLAIQRTVLTIERPALVVIGAGYDGLAYRLAPTKIVIEVDRPEIQDQKCQLLERLPQRRMKFVAASLPAREALPILDVPVTYVAEGVFMYLSEQEVEQVLADLPAGSSIIFTFVGIDEQGRPAMGSNQDQVDRLLATLKEPFRWGIKQVAVAEFLARNGYRLVSLLGDGCEKIEGMIHGEWIAYANKL